MFTLSFKTDNSAFEFNPVAVTADVLFQVARSVARAEVGPGDEVSGHIRDTNGNTIGKWTYEVDEREDEQ